MDEDEAEFGRDLLRDIDLMHREIGYNPTRWRQMLATHGPIEGARRLLRGPDASDGFTRLWEHGRLDATVEWQVLVHHTLFEGEEREVAYRRLESHGAPVDAWLQDRLGRRYP